MIPHTALLRREIELQIAWLNQTEPARRLKAAQNWLNKLLNHIEAATRTTAGIIGKFEFVPTPNMGVTRHYLQARRAFFDQVLNGDEDTGRGARQHARFMVFSVDYEQVQAAIERLERHYPLEAMLLKLDPCAAHRQPIPGPRVNGLRRRYEKLFIAPPPPIKMDSQTMLWSSDPLNP